MRTHNHHSVRAPRRSRRGLTLIELVVGVFIAVFLTAAAVAFAAHETRLMGISQDKLDVSQASRASLELLAADLAMAGAGVGHFESGNFAGVQLGPFTVDACAFNASGSPLVFNPPSPPPQGAYTNVALRAAGPQGTFGAVYTSPTVDIGIRFADGAYATVAQYNSAGGGQFCAGPNIRFQPNEMAVLRTGDGLAAHTVVVNTPNVAGPCAFGQCVGGCANFVFNPTTDFQSSSNTLGLEYQGGELQGGYKQIVWFVVGNGTVGTLRRAVFDTSPPVCPGRSNAVGGTVADNVEALEAQMYQYVTDPAVFAGAPAWVNVGQAGVNTRFRTRVDLEVVIRSSGSVDRMRPPVRLYLRTNTCVPSIAGCTTNPVDYGDREVFRTSVEIKNASLGGT